VTIGVFDSGVGGLSVLQEIRTALPHGRLIYVADSKHLPYGTKAPAFIRDRSVAIARFLIEARQSDVVVVGCNTATTHAVDVLRRLFGHVAPIVGMEPAVKPAALATRSGVVGVLATGATLAGERVAALMERNADGIEIVTQACPGLVEQVEAGDLAGPHTHELIQEYTRPLLSRGADAIVLGCTHFNFLQPTIERIVGPTVTLFGAASAVARQTCRVLAANGKPADQDTPGSVEFLTSGEPSRVRPVLERLWGEPIGNLHRLPPECTSSSTSMAR
jgi:glutamate racemase